MIDLLFLGGIAFALVRAWRARFLVGLAAATLRLMILVVSVLLIGVTLFSPNPSLVGAPTQLAVFAAGPIVSFAMTFVTWRRMRNVPYLEEEAASRVFMPWVVIACVDAVYVVLMLFAVAITKET